MKRIKTVMLWAWGVLTAVAVSALVYLGWRNRRLVHLTEREWIKAMSEVTETDRDVAVTLERLDAERRDNTSLAVDLESSAGDLNDAIDRLRG